MIADIVDASGNADLWIYDVARGLKTKLTFDPAWRADGREIFYVGRNGKLTAVELLTTPDGLVTGRTTELFELRGDSYTASPDGQRFLVDLRTENPETAPYTIVFNWTQALKRN